MPQDREETVVMEEVVEVEDDSVDDSIRQRILLVQKHTKKNTIGS